MAALSMAQAEAVFLDHVLQGHVSVWGDDAVGDLVTDLSGARWVWLTNRT